MSERVEIVNGDSLLVLQLLDDNSVDAIVTDPPYGLSFMGKKWDYDVPSEELWRQCFRVLKAGGHLLCFAGTRTQHRMAVRIEDAGFEIRDMIAWVYGSGFPKSLNLKGDWQGWGTALKPALEPITVARKPLIGTVAENVLQHGTGAINVDGCRVGTEEIIDFKRKENAITASGWKDVNRNPYKQHSQGRWPANFIHDGSEEVVGLFPYSKSVGGDGYKNSMFAGGKKTGGHGLGDAGSAARFFYCAKASKRDRDEGNNHPTVKPTDLMRYLCRLVTPPDGTVLDPFMGSGSTGKAAVLEGFRFIGIEREEEYCEIAKARIKHAQQ